LPVPCVIACWFMNAPLRTAPSAQVIRQPLPRRRKCRGSICVVKWLLLFSISFSYVVLLIIMPPKLEPSTRSSVYSVDSLYNSLNNRTRFDVALGSNTPPTVFCCGGTRMKGTPEFFDFLREFLPEHKPDSKSLDGKWLGYLERRHSSEYDVFVIDYGKGLNCDKGGVTWLFRRFKGQFVWMTGESGEYPLSPPFDMDDSRHHVFGPHEEGRPNDMTLTYMQITWWNTFKTVLTSAAMIDGSLRPNGGNKIHFLVYGHGNCVHYRNEAFGRLSTIGLVHQAGKCGPPQGADLTNVTKVDYGVSIYNWRNNFLNGHFSRYRFCLVMEHSDEFPFYVTEKILAAFASGCVPIYYGPREIIHRIFNEKAFVYYDVKNPLPALSQVAQLEMNTTLYNEMMAEPILVDGESTFERYFTFADQVRKRLNIPL